MIKNSIVRYVQKSLGLAGLKLTRVETSKSGWIKGSQAAENTRIYVGSGPDSRPGYINCDIRAVPGVQLVCPAWDLSKFVTGVDAVYSRHTLEHLTDEEARLTLDDWFTSLRVGGTVEIIVHNIRFHIDQWLSANWHEEGKIGEKTCSRWAFAGFYGWQRECDPRQLDYNTSYWDVHKSGYDTTRIEYLLEISGFGRIETEVLDQCHLVARATKITQKGERQISPTLDGIRADHRARYELASDLLTAPSTIGDFACGVGYGSYILSNSHFASAIQAGDIDSGAIEYAQRYYSNSKITHSVMDLSAFIFPIDHFDMITSFETIEHVEDAPGILGKLYASLKPGGTFLCSTPNEDVIPLAVMNNPYHHRHYTPAQFEALLTSAGFDIVAQKTQRERESALIEEGWHGMYNIAICRKPVVQNS